MFVCVHVCLNFPTAYIVLIALWNKYAAYRERKIRFWEFNLELGFLYNYFSGIEICCYYRRLYHWLCKVVENIHWQCWVNSMSCVFVVKSLITDVFLIINYKINLKTNSVLQNHYQGDKDSSSSTGSLSLFIPTECCDWCYFQEVSLTFLKSSGA